MSKNRTKKNKKNKKNKRNNNRNNLNRKQEVDERVDPLRVLVTGTYIAVAIILVACAILSFTDIIPSDKVVLVMTLALIVHQLVTGYVQFVQKKYSSLSLTVVLIMFIIAAYFVITGKLSIDTIKGIFGA